MLLFDTLERCVSVDLRSVCLWRGWGEVSAWGLGLGVNIGYED